jgi:hypothetical protein
MCGMSGNLGASNSWDPQGLSRPVMGLLYLYLYSNNHSGKNITFKGFFEQIKRKLNVIEIKFMLQQKEELKY